MYCVAQGRPCTWRVLMAPRWQRMEAIWRYSKMERHDGDGRSLNRVEAKGNCCESTQLDRAEKLQKKNVGSEAMGEQCHPCDIQPQNGYREGVGDKGGRPTWGQKTQSDLALHLARVCTREKSGDREIGDDYTRSELYQPVTSGSWSRWRIGVGSWRDD